MKTILVTGGAGFIGSALVRQAVNSDAYKVVNFDKLTYAGNLDSLAEVEHHPHHVFVRGDICDASAVREALKAYRPEFVIHLAAESHVDRSIDGPALFVETNVMGTCVLLQETLSYWRTLDSKAASRFRFLHVSTDEVYGSLADSGYFTEETPYAPNSPYSASKAASDHLVRAWYHTYGFPALTTNCSNNYGPYQFPEKLIPLIVQRALGARSLPVYGDGRNVRDWLFVEDHARALLSVVCGGLPGQTYNIGGNSEKKNIDVVFGICDILDEFVPDENVGPRRSLIEFVRDRPGHDFRYAIDCSKIKSELGWRPQESFDSGLRRTVKWYLDNRSWVERVLSGAYRTERLGLG